MIPAVGILRRSVAWLLYERRYGLDTAREVRLAELGLEHPERTHYGPSGWRTLEHILPASDVSPDDVFVDLGSGKGRAVYLAARYPFKRVIGVEIGKELHEIAERNLRAVRRRLACQDVELVNSDVLEYELPDDVTVVFMFNPFGGTIFEAVLAKIVGSIDRNPRSLRLVYGNPVEEQRVLTTGRARLVREHRTAHSDVSAEHAGRICLYELR